MKKAFSTLFIINMLLTLTGCSSVMSHTGGNEKGYYPGTKASYAMLSNDTTGWGTKSLVALDIPFTAIMDSVLLPWDAFRTDESLKSRVEESEQQNATTNNAILPI